VRVRARCPARRGWVRAPCTPTTPFSSAPTPTTTSTNTSCSSSPSPSTSTNYASADTTSPSSPQLHVPMVWSCTATATSPTQLSSSAGRPLMPRPTGTHHGCQRRVHPRRRAAAARQGWPHPPICQITDRQSGVHTSLNAVPAADGAWGTGRTAASSSSSSPQWRLQAGSFHATHCCCNGSEGDPRLICHCCYSTKEVLEGQAAAAWGLAACEDDVNGTLRQGTWQQQQQQQQQG
jgi:hypothetical protein